LEVRLFPTLLRPGVGLVPRRESQRPLLPQHARHCPVLEAGSSLGFLVYPPLEPKESYYFEYQGEGRYRFVYYINPTGATWEPIFVVAMTMSVGGVGMLREDVTFLTRVAPMPREDALLIAHMFYVPEDVGTPAGSVSLRGAWNFQTPTGWDAVYTPIFNVIERPAAPMMVIRVETDWFAHETEFRYVLEPGEGISGYHNIPIGQVVFVPREEITVRNCTDEEVAAIRRAQSEFAHHKAATQLTTPYGLTYSPEYLKQSRAQRSAERTRPPAAVVAERDDPHVAAAPSPAVEKVGRNDPCPCGSGKKYKKCHGAAGSG
jgi:hypothetical protein